MFTAAQAPDDNLYNLLNFNSLLDELSEDIRVESGHMHTLLELYVKSLKWDNHSLQNRVMNCIRDELEDREGVFSFAQLEYIFRRTMGIGIGNQLREFAVALAYYQRCYVEGAIKTEQKLVAGDMVRLFNELDGFMEAYLQFEDRHKRDFPRDSPKDPRDRRGEMDSCYFHIHGVGESCNSTMDIDG